MASFKADKAASVAHHVAAWASETGKGLLFFSERADKAAPQGAIHLAEANEPTTEGANKFHFSAKGLKHTFKASSAAERDNWVSQLKLKIAEAKELVPTVTESENYKKTIESFKPVVKKEEKAPAAAEAAKEEPAKEEAAKDAEAPAAEAKKEEVKKEEPKRRSASRKRNSIFGTLLGGKKDEEKKATEPAAEAATETTAAETTEAPAEAAAAATETPAAEAAETTETPAATEAAADAETAEEPKVEAKPKPVKRGSIFGNLLKKKATEPEAAAATPAKEEAPAAEAVAENAPVIPAVETTEPLSTDVAATEEAAEPTEAAVAVTNGETKKEVKSEKRKSSLPFGLGSKKEKSTTSDDEAEKPKSPFSKLRATIKGKGKADKPAEKPEEKAAEAEASKDAEPAKEEAAAAPAEAEPAVEAAVPADKAIATAPVIPAAA